MREYPVWVGQWEIYPKARIARWSANGNLARWNNAGHVWVWNVPLSCLNELAQWIWSQQAAAQGAG